MKLDMRQKSMESCALDGEGNCIKRRAEHGRAKTKVGVANRTWPI